MSLDLLREDRFGDWDPPSVSVGAAYLVGCLCIEAGVCLHDPQGNVVEMAASTFAVDEGLLVKDNRGQWFRLRVTAIPLNGLEVKP